MNSQGEVAVAVPIARDGGHNDAFVFPPDAVAAAEKAIVASGLRRCGTYHSHPRSAPVPSEADRLVIRSDELMLIVGASGGCGAIRLWRLSRCRRFMNEVEWKQV